MRPQHPHPGPNTQPLLLSRDAQGAGGSCPRNGGTRHLPHTPSCPLWHLSHPGPPPAGQTPGDPGPRLSQLSVTDVTTSSLRLNWEAPQGAFDSFLLRFGVPAPSTLEPRQRPPLQRELMVPGTRRSAVLRDLRPGTLYSLTLYGLRGPHKADSVQGTARTLSPGRSTVRWLRGSLESPGEGRDAGHFGSPGQGPIVVLSLCPVLESPRDLEFSDIRETSATVSWTPPPSRVDSFKVSYQLADGGDAFGPRSCWLSFLCPRALPPDQPPAAPGFRATSRFPPYFQGSRRACRWTAGPRPTACRA